jgi:endonuclease III
MTTSLHCAVVDDPARVEGILQLAAQARERSSGRVAFTSSPEADALLNDLQHHPHAFVLGCLMSRQVRAEKAWILPWAFRERSGSFEIAALARLTEPEVLHHMVHPTPLHRLPMAGVFRDGVQRIVSIYGGDASRMWSGSPPSAAIVRRFLEFRGAGPKIATMAANLLVSLLGVPVSDRYSIDISPDRHIRRVFSRLGFVPNDADDDVIIYRARELSPEYPGAFDLLFWEVGRNTCRPENPQCTACVLAARCPRGHAT